MALHTGVAGIALATIATCVSASAIAQHRPSIHLDLPQQDLAVSLRAVGRTSGRQIIIATDAVAGKSAPALRGDYAVDDAIRLLLRDSGVQYRLTSDAILVGEVEGLQADDRRAEPGAGEVTVTGTRIRSAPTVSPVTVLNTRDAMKDGQASVAAMIAAVPQNFGGGQNPGIGPGVPGTFNETGASSFNLRGLGSDATLTLINGHRVAYGGSAQSIDVSAVPFLAVDRIEIVPDGSSALYGSDAVAGVANVVLKDRFDGVKVASNIGIPTSGGGASQQYGVLAGTKWQSGNIFAAYEYGYSDELNANDRARFAAVAPGLTLFPALEHHNVAAKLEQAISDGITLSVEGFYNHRTSVQVAPSDLVGNYRLNGQQVSIADNSFAIIPTLRVALGPNWSLSASGSYASDHSRYVNAQWFSGIASSPFVTCYCNSSQSAELNAEGPLIHLAGGDARLAIGAGYRANRFRQTNSAIDATQDNYYAYGELDLPLVSAEQGIAGIAGLNLNLAARFEDYPSVGRVVTPRIGAIYSPVHGVAFKATWGESFRAPTLYQEYRVQAVYLYPARLLGASGASASAAALLSLGGNRDLKPERAKTLSATIELMPDALPGAHVALTYYEVRYRDRIVTPIAYLSQSLRNPDYSAYVRTAPTLAEQAALLSQVPLTNYFGKPYDPANVAAIVLNNSVNAERQFVRGVDISADYRFNLAANAAMRLVASGSYIDSSQYVIASRPREQLAGQLFHPPHFRGRAGARFESDVVSISAFANYIGGVTDARSSPSAAIGSMTTVDLALTYQPRWSGWKNFSATFALENVGNVLPGLLANTIVGNSPYDSTNYSPIGRRFSLSIVNKW